MKFVIALLPVNLRKIISSDPRQSPAHPGRIKGAICALTICFRALAYGVAVHPIREPKQKRDADNKEEKQ
jgi:hypothetical protein